ncbi:MAG: MBL fold metallo-hydrolase [Ottowia sp.]|nr:MBL fold metallo-hydrolase [Ottowia sp.]
MAVRIIPVTLFAQNCTLLICAASRSAVIIDPGGDLPRILEQVSACYATVEKILLTHGHLDHCSAAGTLAAQLGVPIEGPHRDELAWLEQLDAQRVYYGFPKEAPVLPSRWLADGDTVCFGAVKLDVYHCPGHTPGHVVFYSEADRFAVVGDVLFAGAIGRTDLPLGNHADLIRSICEKLWPLGDGVTFVPGHGRISTFGAERAHNPYVSDEVLAAR